MADLPVFFNEDGQTIIDGMKADMESRLGKSIAPADIEMLLINGFAYREQLLRIQANEAARQNLVSFATGSALDYLGLLVGVIRLPPTAAACSIQFNFVAGHSVLVLPSAIRVQSVDGSATFITTDGANIDADTATIIVPAICTTEGKSGNGFTPGTISIILDPQAFISSAANTNTTQGGSDAETDDQLRERIELAPSTFSVAGPYGAYKFFAKSANPAITDVAIMGPPVFAPGEVHIFPLMEGGGLPNAEVLAAVDAVCDDEKVRPLTDTVIVAAPTVADYDIQVELTLFNDAIQSDTEDAVTAALNDYKTSRQNTLGLDVIRNQIVAKCMIPGKVYNVNVVLPAANIVADAKTYTRCDSVTVTTSGFNEG